MTAEADYEKLGLFYLGRTPETGGEEPQPVLYDSRHLVTHGLCVGMTGSGKTGLGIGLLEEAAIDGVPSLIIDPKGDMGNLLLSFPDLAPADFEPWVEAAEADRKGISRSELAEREAEKWSKGIADWGQGPERIRRFRDAVDITLYTPGSTAGVPLAVLSSLSAPGAKTREDRELMGDRVATATSSLLGLADLDSDSRSREHVLLATLIGFAWERGQDLDLPTLIQQVQSPPVTRIGVLELESFYPAKERFELAMALNSLLASPGFSAWLEGEALDIDQMLYGVDGKPRIAICSIAHLDDRERMFFVALLLEQVVAWMREQSGTGSLRALLYMDEIFGFLPPVAEPASKRPLLTLLKQARAYGLGLLLATQNPVDIDYKALSNIGTWFLGRLQTERDKLRLLDGLEGASSADGFSRSELDDLLSGLPGRTFLLHDVREDGPVLFQTRWVLSYLKGPLTRREIEFLTEGETKAAPLSSRRSSTPSESSPPSQGEGVGSHSKAAEAPVPVLPSSISARYIDLTTGAVRRYEPCLFGTASVRFEDRKTGVRLKETLEFQAEIPGDNSLVEWALHDEEIASSEMVDRPPMSAPHADLGSLAARSKSYTAWKRELLDHIYHEHRLGLWKSPSLEETSRPGESEREFRIRLGDLARARRDEERVVLQERYDKKLNRQEIAIDKAEKKVEIQKEQLSGQTLSTAVSLGGTLLKALLGRKRLSRSAISGASSTVRGVGRSRREAADVERAEDDLRRKQQALEELEAELGRELLEISERYRPDRERLETVEVAPLKKNIRVQGVELLWIGR